MLQATPARIVSIDHFRGYAVAGMILVNFLGTFAVMPWQFKHHETGMSYADTIAPLFIFVVGMGLRVSLRRRVEKDGAGKAHLGLLRKLILLTLIGVLIYGPWPTLWWNWWDALVDIGLGGILALPVLARPGWARAGAAVGYLALYQAIFSFTGYGQWVIDHSFNGGPLGPLSWASILLFGTLAQDIAETRNARAILLGCLAWGGALQAAGWALRMEWPGVKPAWEFSQYWMTAPYPLVSAGLCFLMYPLFFFACDRLRLRVPHLEHFGWNALAIYILQYFLIGLHKAYGLPGDSSVPVALAGFAVVYGICALTAWLLARKKWILKL